MSRGFRFNTFTIDRSVVPEATRKSSFASRMSTAQSARRDRLATLVGAPGMGSASREAAGPNRCSPSRDHRARRTRGLKSPRPIARRRRNIDLSSAVCHGSSSTGYCTNRRPSTSPDQHSQRVSALNSAHRRLWRVAVYGHPDLTDGERRLLKAAAEQTFGVPSRYVPDATPQAYLEELFEMVAEEHGWTLEDRRALAGQPLTGETLDSRGAAERLIEGLIEGHRAKESAKRAPADQPPEPEQRLPGLTD